MRKLLYLSIIIAMSYIYHFSDNLLFGSEIIITHTQIENNQKARSKDCNKLPEFFTSYQEATRLVKQAKFKYKDVANTNRSSWIWGARYYSCDGLVGYLIIQTNRGEYIHSDLPISIWKQFKKAESYGQFYNYYIKGDYQVQLK